MAKTVLPTNFTDDILNGAMNGMRRYREIPNDDGTISLEDATTYDQTGSNFGATQINLMNQNINESLDVNKIIKDKQTLEATAVEGFVPDALLVKGINDSLVNENNESFNFGVKDGVRGFYTDPSRADDSFVPFKTSNKYVEVNTTDLGAWDTQIIDTGLDEITAFYLTHTGKYASYTIFNFFDQYVINNAKYTGSDIYKEGGKIVITYRASGKFNCGDGKGPMTIYAL